MVLGAAGELAALAAQLLPLSSAWTSAPAAAAHLRTEGQLAAQSGHTEMAAWCLETKAWQVLTAGDYPGEPRIRHGRTAPAAPRQPALTCR